MNESVSQHLQSAMQFRQSSPDISPSSPMDHLQRLSGEHALYARRLEELMARPWLTEAEKVEEVRLKKLKLRLKDEMEAIRRGTPLLH